MNKTLSVSAIENGTVIDHIPAGQALRIIQLLNITTKNNKVTIGLNLPSKLLKFKDLIKIEDRILNETEANDISVFAPEATINIIKKFTVSKKISVTFPQTIIGIFVCPNLNCITHTESINSYFYIKEIGKRVKLSCKYCESQFDRDQVRERVT